MESKSIPKNYHESFSVIYIEIGKKTKRLYFHPFNPYIRDESIVSSFFPYLYIEELFGLLTPQGPPPHPTSPLFLLHFPFLILN